MIGVIKIDTKLSLTLKSIGNSKTISLLEESPPEIGYGWFVVFSPHWVTSG